MRRRRELREVSRERHPSPAGSSPGTEARNSVRRLKNISSHESAPPKSEIQQEVCLKYLGEVVTDSDARCHGPFQGVGRCRQVLRCSKMCKKFG